MREENLNKEGQPEGQQQRSRPSRPGCAISVHKAVDEKALKSKNPVISVDTKKKEVPGAYKKNGGKERHKKGESPRVASSGVY
jgi:hypothetical protein